jgi:methyltransferase (TIGR00027 family)
MTKAATKTGYGPILAVAIEQNYPKDQRIIDDNLAYQMLPPVMRFVVRMTQSDWIRNGLVREAERVVPGIWGGMIYRKRYIDAKVMATSGQIGVLVNLGAGFDTRAFRLSALAHVQIWEVDVQENLERKQVLLQKVLGEIPKNVHFIPIDFDCEDLETVLSSHGYSLNDRTFFIYEGVLQYLTETGVRATFDFLTRVVPGSRLVFTYVRKDFINGQVMYDQEATYKRYVIKDKSWLFGIAPEEVPSFLTEYGWQIIEHLGYEDLVDVYVKPTGRNLSSTPIERLVYAEKLD